jgi:hypothetical protein
MANPEDNGASVASGNRPAFGYTLHLAVILFVRHDQYGLSF